MFVEGNVAVMKTGVLIDDPPFTSRPQPARRWVERQMLIHIFFFTCSIVTNNLVGNEQANGSMHGP